MGKEEIAEGGIGRAEMVPHLDHVAGAGIPQRHPDSGTNPGDLVDRALDQGP